MAEEGGGWSKRGGLIEDWTCEFGADLSRSSGECKREGGEAEARLRGEGWASGEELLRLGEEEVRAVVEGNVCLQRIDDERDVLRHGDVFSIGCTGDESDSAWEDE